MFGLPSGRLIENLVTLQIESPSSATALSLVDSIPPAVQALAGMTLVRVAVDDAGLLALRAAGREAIVRIDGAGLIHDSKGVAHAFDPDESPQSLGVVLGLLQQRVNLATVANDGSLCLQIGENVLTVQPHDHQVSWDVKTSDDRSAACLAGGMVVWR